MTYRHHIDEFFMAKIVKPAFFGLPAPTEEELKSLEENVSTSFKSVKFILDLYGGPFLLGEHLTLADFTYYFTSMGAVYLGDAKIQDHPEVYEWFKRVEETPSVTKIMDEYKKNADTFKEVIAKKASDSA
mmetsp:Transcript_12066/g.13728  ORF Transcript_12066/g.13728 Transcript_12066/m.13728 type:complete len:130 (-) Transcript_12066:27-416(-)